MVLGHGASFSSNTLPSISSVMCGGVLKKCSICTRSQKSNLYAVQLIMLQASTAQHHSFAHIIIHATLETVSPFVYIYIYTTLPYVMKMIHFQVKTSMFTCMPPVLEFTNLKNPNLGHHNHKYSANHFHEKRKKKNISFTVYKTNP